MLNLVAWFVLIGCASCKMLIFQQHFLRFLTIHNIEAWENAITQPNNVNHFILLENQRVKILAQSDLLFVAVNLHQKHSELYFIGWNGWYNKSSIGLNMLTYQLENIGISTNIIFLWTVLPLISWTWNTYITW